MSISAVEAGGSQSRFGAGAAADAHDPPARWEIGRDPRFARPSVGRCLLTAVQAFAVGAVLPMASTEPRVAQVVVVACALRVLIPSAVAAFPHLRRAPDPAARDAALDADWRGERRTFRARLLAQRCDHPFSPLICFAAALVAGWSLWFTYWPAATLALGVIFALARRAWLGGVEVAWPEFPLRAGTTVTFHVATGPGSGRLESPWVWLGCHETRTVLGLRFDTRRVASATAWRRSGALAQDPGPGEFVEFDVAIPADAPGTRLRGATTVHWVLVVGGRLRGQPFTECILVPVAGAAAVPAETASETLRRAG